MYRFLSVLKLTLRLQRTFQFCRYGLVHFTDTKIRLDSSNAKYTPSYKKGDIYKVLTMKRKKILTEHE